MDPSLSRELKSRDRETERERDGYTHSQGQREDTEKYIGKVEQQIAESVC
jgi:hypothetical protein